jgi:hypothetical protein
MSFPANTTGLAAEAAAPRQEAVMGEAIPRQHPAVVLRSHFNLLRALLAAAVIAVIGLTVAVVILANDSDKVSSTSSAAKPVGSINYGGSTAVNPSTGYPTVPLRQLEQPLQQRIDGTRYDGGPEEGTRGIARPAQPSVSPETEIKDEAGTAAAIARSSSATEMKDEAGTAAAIGRSNSSSATEMKDEAGTAAAIGRSSSATEMKDEAASAAAIGRSSAGNELRGSKASQYGTSQYRFAQP